MHMLSILAVFTVLGSNVWAQSSIGDCVEIEGNLARLDCYDTAAKVMLDGGTDPRAAFNIFNELAHRDYEPSFGGFNYQFEDCHLLAVNVTTQISDNAKLSFLGPPRLGGLRMVQFFDYTLPNAMKHFDGLSIGFLYIDMREIETIVRSRGDSVQITMKRGTNAMIATVQASFDFANVPYAMTATQDSARFEALLNSTEANEFLARFLNQGFGSHTEWREISSSEPRLIAATIGHAEFPQADGYRSQSTKQERQITYRLAQPWPEDAEKISGAFANLVSACQ